MKAPSFQYYPADWRADAISGCSLAARGLWHEMLNMMHGTERYGYLQANGLPIPDETIARYCGCSVGEYQSLLSELDAARVPRRNHMSIIFCARMVADHRKRDEWRKQKKNQRDKGKGCPQNVRKMSALSSSSSSSSNLNTKPSHTPFKPPDELEVAAYMTERGIGNAFYEAEQFVAYHATRNWRFKDGKGAEMANWKKAVITWQGNIAKFGANHGRQPYKTAAEKRHEVSARAIGRVFGDVVGDVHPSVPATDGGAGCDGVSGGPKKLFGHAN